jgi:hypothetical protein
MTIKNLASRTISGLKGTWADLEYTQRRALEVSLITPVQKNR